MSRRLPPSWWVVWHYTRHDLSSLPARTWLGLVAGPLLILVPLAVFGGAMLVTGGGAQDVLLVHEDRAAHPGLQRWVEGLDEDLRVTVVDQLPDDAEDRLAAGELDLLAVVPEGLDELEALDVRQDRGIDAVDADELREALVEWVGSQEVAARAGGEARLTVVRPDGSTPPPRDPNNPVAWLFDPESGLAVRKGLGWFVVGLFGTLAGTGVGVKVVESASAGFNHVLGLGTSRRAIYASEMLTGAVLAVVQAASWWLCYGLALAVAAAAFEVQVEPPPLDRVVADGALLATLGALALVQACAVGCLGALLVRNVDASLRQAVSRVAFFAVFLGAMGFASRAGDAAYAIASAVPVLGPVALWSHYVETGEGLLLLVLQVGYAILALDIGSRLFLMDESPLERLRRRLSAATRPTR